MRARPASALLSAGFLPITFNVLRAPLLLLCLVCEVLRFGSPSRISLLIMGIDVFSLPIKLLRRWVLSEFIGLLRFMDGCRLIVETEGLCFIIELAMRDVLIEFMRLPELMPLLWSTADDFATIGTDLFCLPIKPPIRDVLFELITVLFLTEGLTPVGTLLLGRPRAPEGLRCLLSAVLRRTDRRVGVRLSVGLLGRRIGIALLS